MIGYRDREGFLPPDAAAADLATTSRLVGGGADSEGAVNSLRRQLHLPTPVDLPLGVLLGCGIIRIESVRGRGLGYTSVERPRQRQPLPQVFARGQVEHRRYLFAQYISLALAYERAETSCCTIYHVFVPAGCDEREYFCRL